MRKIGHGLTQWTTVAISLGVASILLTIGTLSALAQQPPALSGPKSQLVVIMHCVYYSLGSSSAFRTEVRGIEVSGRADLGLQTGGACSDAVSQLASLGFVIVNSTSTSADYNGDGMVDTGDFVVWKK